MILPSPRDPQDQVSCFSELATLLAINHSKKGVSLVDKRIGSFVAPTSCQVSIEPVAPLISDTLMPWPHLLYRGRGKFRKGHDSRRIAFFLSAFLGSRNGLFVAMLNLFLDHVFWASRLVGVIVRAPIPWSFSC